MQVHTQIARIRASRRFLENLAISATGMADFGHTSLPPHDCGPTMNSMAPQPPPRRTSLPPWSGPLVRLLAVSLFLFIGWLTIPKLAERMYRLQKQREARVEIARQQAGKSPLDSETVRPMDVLLIAAVTVGGGIVLASLGYCVLKRQATAVEKNQLAQPPQEQSP
jgi:hypothetical protein